MNNKKKINLAIQGGGAHGAYAWGILDKLLEEDIFEFNGISATSAGSMNAIVLAQGLIEGGNDKARELLHDFWLKISISSRELGFTQRTPWDFLWGPFLKQIPLNIYLFNELAGIFSPYQFNPMNYQPLRELLESIVNIEKLKKESKLKLFICATNVRNGKLKIFKEDSISIDAVLASTCLPKLFQSVEIDNEHYWDGGYLGDPAIFPLIYETEVKDILILHMVPIVREEPPTNVIEIDTRLREICFNSSIMREMRAIHFVTKLIDEGWIKDEFKGKLKRLYMHSIRADSDLADYSSASVLVPEWDFLIELRDLGRKACEQWIKENYQYVGNKSTLDFDEFI